MDVTSRYRCGYHVILLYATTLAMMDVCCCLCRNPVAVDHRNRKKVHGTGCTVEKVVLMEVLLVSLEALVETRDPVAVLCSSCERSLNNIL